MTEEENVDTQNLCEPLEPLSVKREQTDIPILVAFITYLVFWICIANYAFTMGDGKINLDGTNDHQQNDSNANKMYSRNRGIDLDSFKTARFIILEFVLLSILLNIIYVIASKVSAKNLLSKTCHLTTYCIAFTVHAVLHALPRGSYISSIWMIGILIFTITEIVAENHIFQKLHDKFKATGEFIHGMSTFVFYLPHLLLVPIFQSTYQIAVTVFTAYVMIYLSTLPLTEVNSAGGQTAINIFHMINIFGFLWTMIFIKIYSQMLLAGCFTTWLWSKNEQNAPKSTMCLYTSIIIIYHSGTVAYAALMSMIFSFVRIILKLTPKSCFSRFESYQKKRERLENFLRRTDMYAGIISCVQGTPYNQSVNDASNLLVPDSTEYSIPDRILLVEQFSVIGLSSALAYFFCELLGYEKDVQYAATATILVTSLIITRAFFTPIKIARDTLGFTINKVIENEYFETRMFSSPKMSFVKNSWLSNTNESTRQRVNSMTSGLGQVLA